MTLNRRLLDSQKVIIAWMAWYGMVGAEYIVAYNNNTTASVHVSLSSPCVLAFDHDTATSWKYLNNPFGTSSARLYFEILAVSSKTL